MIKIKTEEEILIMAEGGKILSGILKELQKEVRPGIKTLELDNLTEKLISKAGGKPSFKGYNSFPSALCISVNDEVVHGVPSQRELKDGDIVSLDIGMKYKGYHSDMAVTLPVGEISKEAKKLLEVTKRALEIGISKAKAGRTFGDIGNAIQEYAESQGFGVVRDLCGHGIGRDLHEDPEILNYGRKGSGSKIEKGMVFCLEPMITAGDWKIKMGRDGYVFRTRDGSLSAHFEHMMAITKDGCRVLTK
jgi:methionyl aminopeptidase